jgi:hypothetical protein
MPWPCPLLNWQIIVWMPLVRCNKSRWGSWQVNALVSDPLRCPSWIYIASHNQDRPLKQGQHTYKSDWVCLNNSIERINLGSQKLDQSHWKKCSQNPGPIDLPETDGCPRDTDHEDKALWHESVNANRAQKLSLQRASSSERAVNS